MQLLPCDPSLSWTRYAWLVYMPIIFVQPLVRHASAWTWVATGVAAAVFLVLYFVGYWVGGVRLLLVVAALFALGASFAPWNANCAVFVIYAAAFAGRLEPPRLAVGILAALILAVGAESWALQLSPAFWIMGTALPVLVGGVNLHFVQLARTNARLHASQEQVQQLVRIAERERIARDLHDLLGHTLSVIALKAELARKLVTISPDRAANEMREVEEVTRDALREVRGALAGYRSEGLTAELARARLALEAAGVRAEYYTVPVALPAAAEAVLALAVREAVTNLIRHAGAATCRIVLERRGADVILEVADDGRGGAGAEFGADAGMGAVGSGLRAMRERLAGVGGRLDILSGESATAPLGGTLLRVTLPDRHPAPPPPPPAQLAVGSIALLPEQGR